VIVISLSANQYCLSDQVDIQATVLNFEQEMSN